MAARVSCGSSGFGDSETDFGRNWRYSGRFPRICSRRCGLTDTSERNVSMEIAAVMDQLKSVGTEETATTYKRHGAGDNVFGVKYADLKKLKKKIGVNHDLALELWETGNSDARSLAMMVADPDDVTPTVATQWMKDVSYDCHAGEIAGVIGQSSCGLAKMRQWRKQKSEYARTTGYKILCQMLQDDPESVDEMECTSNSARHRNGDSSITESSTPCNGDGGDFDWNLQGGDSRRSTGNR